MALAPQAVQAIAAAGDLPTGLTPQELRIVYTRERMKLQPPRPDIAIAREIEIPARGGPIPSRVYTPADDDAVRPLLVYFHGGGWTVGSLEGYDTSCRRLALKANCTVVSVVGVIAPLLRGPRLLREVGARRVARRSSRSAPASGSARSRTASGGSR